MSKNDKIRKGIETLPIYPKFTATGRVMRDSNGNMIAENHFRVIRKLRYEAKGDKHKEDRLVLAYMKKVRSWDVKRRSKLLKSIVTIIITGVILIGLSIYFIFN